MENYPAQLLLTVLLLLLLLQLLFLTLLLQWMQANMDCKPNSMLLLQNMGPIEDVTALPFSSQFLINVRVCE